MLCQLSYPRNCSLESGVKGLESLRLCIHCLLASGYCLSFLNCSPARLLYQCSPLANNGHICRLSIPAIRPLIILAII